jgi:deoxyadenosine/deoxycytidine kinase
MESELILGIVGACGTGKSEIVTRLKERGYVVHHIAQEHSFAPGMWRKIANPDFLVYLEVSYPVTIKRKRFNWSEDEFQEQLYRLRDAREHADIRINTDKLTPDEICNLIIRNLEEMK